MRKMFDESILISIGSDNPRYFGFKYVDDNLQFVAKELGHSKKQMVQWQETAIESSWASPEIKSKEFYLQKKAKGE